MVLLISLIIFLETKTPKLSKKAFEKTCIANFKVNLKILEISVRVIGALSFVTPDHNFGCIGRIRPPVYTPLYQYIHILGLPL